MECPQQEGSKLVNGRTPNHTHKAWYKVKIGAQERGAHLSPIHFQPHQLPPAGSSPPKSLQGMILQNVPGFQPVTLRVTERGTRSQ